MTYTYRCPKCEARQVVFVPVIEILHAGCPRRGSRTAAPRYVLEATG